MSTDSKGGEFLSLVPSFTIPDSERDEKYPGFRWSSCDSDERCWVRKGSQDTRVIEVKGKTYPDIMDGKKVLKQNVVAVLRGDDEVDLYRSLQWLDPSRNHSSVTTGKAMLAIVTLVGFTVVQWVVGVALFDPFGSAWFNVPFLLICALGLSVAELIVYEDVAFSLRIDGKKDVSLQYARSLAREKGEQYVQELVAKLTQSHNRDKAEAAKEIARFI